MSSPKTVVLIPTYNNEKTIFDVVSETKKIHEHVVCINDGSTDQTLIEVIRAQPSAYLNLSQNSGKGAALKAGFGWAKENGFTYAITMDGDGQHYPKSLLAFLNHRENNPDSICIGNRNFGSESGDVTFSSKFGRAFSNFWIFAETFKMLPDTQSGFRSYPVAVVSGIQTSCFSYDFEIEILVKSIWQGVPVTSVPIEVLYPPRSERVSHFKAFEDNIRLTRLHTKLFLTRGLL